jgi:isopenicillin-N epimerase
MTTAHPLASEWELDPASVYLNHGSFGPSPRSVRQAREAWSRQLELQPMRHFCRELEVELDRASEVVAKLLRTQTDRLVLLDNATFAMNVVAGSTPLNPGDEVLLTDHEYGAVRNIWQARCRATGARTAAVTLPFPLDPAATVAAITAALKPETRLLVVSHVTSATACILPIRDICHAARQKGVPVCVDGPHALAMLDLNLDGLGCDYYCGSGHKWLCGPFGSGFLWVHPRRRDAIQTPIVSWGGSIAGKPASWKDSLQWLGTRDAAPLLALADAVRFFSPDVIAEYRSWSHTLIRAARERLLQIPGVSAFCTPAENDFVSMVAVELPQTAGWKPGYHGHPDSLQIQLRDQHGIEVLTGSWSGRRFLRLSAHLYNTSQQLELCTTAVADILQQERHATA